MRSPVLSPRKWIGPETPTNPYSTCCATVKNPAAPTTSFGRTSISKDPRTKLPAVSPRNAHNASHRVRGSPTAKNSLRYSTSAITNTASSGSQSTVSCHEKGPCTRCSVAVTSRTATTARHARRLRRRSACESRMSNAPATTSAAPTAPCTTAGLTLPGSTWLMTLTRSHRCGRTTIAISRTPSRNVKTPATRGTQRRCDRRSLPTE